MKANRPSHTAQIMALYRAMETRRPAAHRLFSDPYAVYFLNGRYRLASRLAAEQLYIRKNRRQMSLLKDTAEQRYIRLLNDYNHFIQLVPLKYLASYIGITPQALSRIRRRIA